VTEPTLVPGTEPYAWPYDGRLDGAHLALVLAGWDETWASRAVRSEPAERRAMRLVGAASTTVPAPGIDGFYASRLDDLLRSDRRTHLLVAGHGIEAPVHSTLRSANDRGYECLLVTDACTSLTDDLGAPAAKQVTMSGGIFGAVGTADAVLSVLPAPVPHLVPSTPQEA
jgi:nicotinamidase-related amidase